ncbi:MAG: prepilin-type N-terminal cleavage/methylation domain-containing protein, partial [Phycisphaerae bacterium]|nr:prepilin-type N-terminal cleavage/methylation domain-containing protein [Phycisphaerae bacterium]
MKHTRKTTGFSLIEMLIVLVIMSIMMAVGMVSAPNLIRSQKTSSARNMIRSSLTQAQAYAARNHCNAGIRFQQSLDGRQYLVLVESRPILVPDQGNYNMSQRYTPVPNAKPSPMPEGMAVLRDDIVDDTYLDSLTELRKAGT